MKGLQRIHYGFSPIRGFPLEIKLIDQCSLLAPGARCQTGWGA